MKNKSANKKLPQKNVPGVAYCVECKNMHRLGECKLKGSGDYNYTLDRETNEIRRSAIITNIDPSPRRKPKTFKYKDEFYNKIRASNPSQKPKNRPIKTVHPSEYTSKFSSFHKVSKNSPRINNISKHTKKPHNIKNTKSSNKTAPMKHISEDDYESDFIDDSGLGGGNSRIPSDKNGNVPSHYISSMIQNMYPSRGNRYNYQNTQNLDNVDDDQYSSDEVEEAGFDDINQEEMETKRIGDYEDRVEYKKLKKYK